MRGLLTLLFIFIAVLDLARAQDKPRLVLRDGHDGEILAVALLEQGLEAVTVGTDGTVKLWDLVGGQVLRTSVERSAQGHADADRYEAACLLPDQDLAVVGDHRNAVKVWNYKTGDLVNSFTIDRGVEALASDGENLFIQNSSFLMKTSRAGDVLAQIDLESTSETAFGLGGPFCIAKDDNELLILDKENLRERHRIPVAFRFSANISPDGRTVVVGSEDSFKLIDSDTGRVTEVLPWTADGYNQEAFQYRAEWSDDGRLFLRRKNGYDGGEILRKTANGLEKAWTDNERGCPTAFAAQKGVGSLIGMISGSFSFVNEAGQAKYFDNQSAANVSFALSPDGRYFFAGSKDGVARSWDLSTGREAKKFEGLENYVSLLQVSPDGKYLAGTSESAGKVVIWEIDSGEIVSAYEVDSVGSRKKLTTFEFLDNERYLVTSPDSRLSIISVKSGEVVDSRPLEGGWAVASPSGRRILSAVKNQLVEWPLSSRRDMVTTGGDDWVDAAYSEDETVVYLVNSRGGLYRWDITDAENKPESLDNMRKHPYGIRVHENGVDVLTAKELYRYSRDGEFRDKKVLTTEAAFSVTLLGDDLLVVRLEGLLSFCDANTGEHLGDFCQFSGIDGWVAMTPDGRFDGNDAGFDKLAITFGGKVYELGQFFQEYYTPGILSTIFPNAKAPKTTTSRQVAELTTQSLKQPPEIEIVSPKSGEIIESETFEVKVKVTSTGAGASRVALFQNGHRLPDTARTALADDTFIFQVKSIAGLNDIKVTAFDGSGTVESRKDRIRVNAPNIPARPPQLHILSIGVDDYQSGLSLNFAAEDAKSVGELFKSELYAPGRRVTLTDSQATREGILSALESLATDAEPQDALVVYLAGHGTVVGDNYLFLPHDADILSDESLLKSSVSSNLLAQKLSAIPATKQLLILDSCRAGAAAQAVGKYLAARSGLEEIRSQQILARTTGTFLIAATTGEDFAYEIEELGHGVLTYSVLDSLGLTSTGDKGVTTANGLLRQVSERVPELSEKYHGVRQQVVQYSSGQDFPLSK